jgi:hypothetical protein
MRGRRKQPQPALSSAESETRGGRLKLEIAQAHVKDGQFELLRRQYRSLTGKAVHPSVPRFLLARAVAYERQSREYGDLPARVVSALAALSKDQLGPPGRITRRSEAGGLVGTPRILPGTILVREHQNVLHRVTALEHGFSWNGKTFASLSAVARAITGVRWNGPRFFALQDSTRRRVPKERRTG